MHWLKNYKNIFFIYAAFFCLLVTGIVPRESSLLIGSLLLVWTLFSSIENGVLLFVSIIPLMVALPITDSFDSLNIWRVLSLVILLKFILQKGVFIRILSFIRKVFKSPWMMIREYPLISSGVLLLILSLVSLIWAPHFNEALKRIIYFINLSFIGLVIWGLGKERDDFNEKILGAINFTLTSVILVGIFQVVSTYFIDIYQFMRLWGEGIQCNQFGERWCYIAVNVGNTWFAYYGEQLSLRVFSLFPDSHSFPVFSLLALPAFFALIFKKIHGLNFISALKTRVSLWVVLVPVIFLTIILSGTRGIWAGALGVPVLALILTYIARKWGMSKESSLIGYIASYMGIFFLLFMVAFPIFSSPQFLLSKGDNDILKHRIRSIIDFGETSNSQRIEIWKQSLEYIKDHPFTGTGIGNYPVVLNQNIELAEAGSSAHNIYLHVWAELGIIGLIILLFIFWKIFEYAWRGMHNMRSIPLSIYSASMLLILPWIYAYLMTDPILFDERVFLLFMVSAGILLNQRTKNT